MPEEMQLVITLRKDVEDVEDGHRLFEVVKTMIASRPDITINGQITNHFQTEGPE